MPAEEYFYIDPNSETVGPISWEVLQQLARAGVVADETLTAPEGASDWMPFAEIKSKEEAKSKLPPVPGKPAGSVLPSSEAELELDVKPPVEYMSNPVASAVGEEVRDRVIQWQMPLLFGAAAICASLTENLRLIVGSEEGQGAFELISVLLGLVALVFAAILHFQCWESLPIRYRATSPGRAVGFLFIPLFNFYWFFVSFPKLSEGYLRWQREEGITNPLDTRGLAVAYAVVTLIYIVAAFVPNPLVFMSLDIASFVIFVCYYERIVGLANQLMRIPSQEILSSFPAWLDRKPNIGFFWVGAVVLFNLIKAAYENPQNDVAPVLAPILLIVGIYLLVRRCRSAETD